MGFRVLGATGELMHAAMDLKADFALTADDYRKYRPGFPDSFFDRLARYGLGARDQVVVDLGTGTGTLARGFARRGCRVIGIDPAAPLLEQARTLDAEANVTVDYRVARAEETGLSSALADVVSAGQCWHWFDRRAAAREAARLLHSGGGIVIAHFDWIPLADNVVRATEKLIESYNPGWKLGGGHGIHPWWLRDLAEARLRDLETFSYDVEVPFTPETWRGRIRASAGVGASLTPDRVAAFDAALAELLAARFPGATLSVPHRVFAVVARAPQPLVEE